MPGCKTHITLMRQPADADGAGRSGFAVAQDGATCFAGAFADVWSRLLSPVVDRTCSSSRSPPQRSTTSLSPLPELLLPSSLEAAARSGLFALTRLLPNRTASVLAVADDADDDVDGEDNVDGDDDVDAEDDVDGEDNVDGDDDVDGALPEPGFAHKTSQSPYREYRSASSSRFRMYPCALQVVKARTSTKQTQHVFN